MTSRPFTYNPGSLIPGTEKFGNLTIGIPESGFESTGLQWWNGPDEDLGYVIASTNVDINGNGLQPTPVLGQLGNVGFNRTNTRMYSELVGLSNVITGQNFTTHYDAKIWLENNGYWSSWVDSIENDIDNFTDRITTDSGQFESIDTILPSLSGIDTGLTASSPSLILTPNGYKETKLYSIKPYDGTGDFTVVRATTATRVNSDGLMEPSPYNLFSWSEDFSNSFWNKSNTTITSNQAIAPDGNLTTDLCIPNTVSGEHPFNPIFSSSNSLIYINSTNTYNWSLYAKPAGNNFFILRLNIGGTWSAVVFNLSTQTIQSVSPNFISADIEDAGNGWSLISCVFTNNTIQNGFQHISSPNGSVGFVGDNISGTYIWGAQLTLGGTKRDYFPTTNRLNIPRIDYSNGGCPGILVEPQRTNLVIQSEQINLWTAGLNTTVTPNISIGPNGTQTANNINITNINGYWRRLGLNLASSTTYTASVFVKKSATTNNKTFRFYYNNNVNSPNNGIYTAVVNLTNLTITTTPTGTITTGRPTIISSLLSDYGSGWYRVIVIFTTGSSAGYSNCEIGFQANGEVVDFDAWGAQLELGSNVTSYIPTTTGAITRNADIIIKTNAIDLIGQTEGSVYIHVSNLTDILTFFSLSNNGQASRLIPYRSGTHLILFFQDNLGTVIYSNLINSFFITEFPLGIKLCLTYNSTTHKYFINGQLIADISASLENTTFSKINIGSFQNDGGQANATFENFLLWKTQLTDEEAINLTTL